MIRAQIEKEFWSGKRVFITGHTGFKGSWLCLWLQSLGSHVKGYSLEPPTTPALFNEASVDDEMESEIGDIRDLASVTKSMVTFNPDVLIHMAAQPLVRLSYSNPVETYSTNVMGTVHVLEAARECSNLRSIVIVTTDKCYENKEWEWGYRENESMGGYDPYSNSKGCVELVTSAYRQSFFSDANGPQLASARAGNVIGGGDWAVDRLIPDAIKAFEKKQPVIVRNPQAIRPWQHVLEPISGYLILAEQLYKNTHSFAEGWNFGPKDEDARSVEWILNKMTQLWGEEASWQLDIKSHPHEANYLKLDISKAKNKLNWQPTWGLSYTLEKIIQWQKNWLLGGKNKDYCLKEINDYITSMKND